MKYSTKVEIKDLIYKVLGAAIKVHKTLGPGLLESVYHKCLKHELFIRKIPYNSELIVPVMDDSLFVGMPRSTLAVRTVIAAPALGPPTIAELAWIV